MPKKIKSPSGRRKKIGELLLADGLIDEAILSKALDIQKKEQNKKIGEILVAMGAVDQATVARKLSLQLNIPFVRLDESKIPEQMRSLFSPAILRKHVAVPLKKQGASLVLAMANPQDDQAMSDLQFIGKAYITPVLATQNDILSVLNKLYPQNDRGNNKNSGTDFSDASIEVTTSTPTGDSDQQDERDLLDIANLAPVVRLTNIIIANAIKARASDIHIEPQKNSVCIRQRVDGMMEETMTIEKKIHASLVSRIKIIAGMDVTIRRKPQDGKAQVKFGGKSYDLRVSTIPTSENEKVTIRILNPDSAHVGLEDLGFDDQELQRFKEAINTTQGIILVTGPTGSGKSSTLYACLNKINTPDVNIVTVEDPVEFDISGINQVQINPKAGITFAAGMRSILRQDPDIILVGEIRDEETATIAFQAAQTGHLVLSTLHTNDAPSAVTRLVDLGVDEFLVLDSLIAVLGQRLVRRVCQKCKAPDTPGKRTMERILPYLPKDKTPTFWKGVGCEACHNKGYDGRMAIFELLIVTSSLQKALKENATTQDIKNIAMKEGYHPLTMDGLKKAMQGLTTVDEILRVAPPEMISETEEAGTGDSGEDARLTPTEQRADKAEKSPAPPVSDMRKTVDSPPTTSFPEKSPFILEESVDSSGVPLILIVDDSDTTRDFLKYILLAENYRVRTAENGQDALEKIAREKPDLLLTDFHMPIMDGISLINNVKADSATSDIPIIMLTAEEEADAEVRVLESGADDYIMKPVDAKRFLARIHKYVKK